jgi:thiamine-phosphate pyrophosphorylase
MLKGYYAILDVKEASIETASLDRRAEVLLAGLPCCLQLRAKLLPAGRMVACAERLQARCAAAGVWFCVNDRLDVALAAGADMVHLGQGDLPLRHALALRGTARRPWVGISTHTVEEAEEAARGGADCLGFGPVFPTQTKADAGAPLGLSRLAEVTARVSLPVVAIGGITLDNLPAVVAAGAAAAAVIAAVDQSADPARAGRAIGAAFTASPRART